MSRGVLIARSRDYERLSVQSSGNEYSRNFNSKEYLFDSNRYIPSKDFIRNKKIFIIGEEKLKNRDKSFPTSKVKTKYMINSLMKSIEKEIFKDKKH